jgi:hypothetical protein
VVGECGSEARIVFARMGAVVTGLRPQILTLVLADVWRARGFRLLGAAMLADRRRDEKLEFPLAQQLDLLVSWDF